MPKILIRAASYVLLPALTVCIVSLPSVVSAQEARVTLDMVPVGIEGEASGAVCLRVPEDYELYEIDEDETSWGEETVCTKDYEYHGTKVLSIITFPDGSQHTALGEQADGIGYGGGMLFIREGSDIRTDAEKHMKPYIEGTVYEVGEVTLVESGVEYSGYYYLSTHTEEHTSIRSHQGEEIEYQWSSVHHTLNTRVALTASEPLYTVALWVHTWGLPDGLHADGSQREYTIDGKPQLERHKEYLKEILANIEICHWQAPGGMQPEKTPEPEGVSVTPFSCSGPVEGAAPPSGREISLKFGGISLVLGLNFWLSQRRKPPTK